jgi:hypothetical protein
MMISGWQTARPGNQAASRKDPQSARLRLCVAPRELEGVPTPGAEVALCRIPGQVHPPGRVVPGLSSGARGNHPYSG